MDEGAEGVAAEIIGRLERAWNAGDGRAFGEPFALDADFVDIRGEHHRGREAIAAGHQAIFDSIYRGSQQTYDLLQTRALSDDVVLVLAQGNLHAPGGPMVGESHSTATLVLVRDGEDWQIASFHNTLIAPSR